MSDLFWLSEAQVERLKPFFPNSRGKPRVDDRRLLSGIIYIPELCPKVGDALIRRL